MNTAPKSASGVFSDGLALLVAGLGIGWLTGLSLTPVIGTVLTSILGAVGGAAAGLTVLGSDKPKYHTSWPVALLIIGIAAGGPLGILARTNNLFGPMFADSEETAERQRAAMGVLFSAGSKSCTLLLGTPDEYLPSALRTSQLPWAPRLADEFAGDPETLRRVVEVLCNE